MKGCARCCDFAASGVRLGKTEGALVRSLERDAFLVERVERLMGIPAIGPINSEVPSSDHSISVSTPTNTIGPDVVAAGLADSV